MKRHEDEESLFAGYPARPYERSHLDTFRRWLANHRIALRDITSDDIESFVERPRGHLLRDDARRQYHSVLRRFIAYASFRGACPGHVLPFSIPKYTQQFLSELKIVNKLSTCNGYRTNIRRFHKFLEYRRIGLEKIGRRDIVMFTKDLADAGLHPATRLTTITNLRVYLRWLFEHELLRRNPEFLIRRSDFPKLPQYLPRPLPMELDQALCEKLAASQSLHARALLLMRRTGIRIGELIGLPYDCITTHGNQLLLKIPLGKMNTERNVPIDSNIQRLVAELRAVPPLHREFLLPRPQGLYALRTRLSSLLAATCQELGASAHITSHQLRHTYATSLINAGMSLIAIMKLLGHRDYRMTLRYAAVTQETVRAEYLSALDKLRNVVPRIDQLPDQQTPSDVRMLLEDSIRAITRLARDGSISSTLRNVLSKRLGRILNSLQFALPPV